MDNIHTYETRDGRLYGYSKEDIYIKFMAGVIPQIGPRYIRVLDNEKETLTDVHVGVRPSEVKKCLY